MRVGGGRDVWGGKGEGLGGGVEGRGAWMGGEGVDGGGGEEGMRRLCQTKLVLDPLSMQQPLRTVDRTIYKTI